MQVLSFLLTSLSLASVSSVEVLDEPEEVPIEREAKFTTIPVNLMINEGDTIRLPCFVERIEGYVLLWKFGETILSVGNKITDSDQDRRPRLELEEDTDGNNLVIHSAVSGDSGQYMCQISDLILRDIRHNVIVRTRPEVTVDRRLVQVDTGHNVTLKCSVISGNILHLKGLKNN